MNRTAKPLKTPSLSFLKKNNLTFAQLFHRSVHHHSHSHSDSHSDCRSDSRDLRFRTTRLALRRSASEKAGLVISRNSFGFWTWQTYSWLWQVDSWTWQMDSWTWQMDSWTWQMDS